MRASRWQAPAGGDLADRKAVAGQALRIVVGLYIAGQNGHAAIRLESRQGALQQHGLAGARRADQVHAQRSMLEKTLAQLRGQTVVFAQNFAFKRYAGHVSSISM
jgi:hypothetical protein